MEINVQKFDYLVNSAKKRILGLGAHCPSCGATYATLVAHKYWVTQLRRCEVCKLLFRTPGTSDSENAAFYQKYYKQGFTTDVPSSDELFRLMSIKFSGTEKDYSRFITILETLGIQKDARVFDFGCSWGYGSWQFLQGGYDTESYEISVPRGDFARQKLGCTVHSNPADVRPGFDVFFSSHVLEHVPSVKKVINFATSILRPGGLFLAFTPNGSMAHRAKDPSGWQKLWGLVHPNFLDDQYYRHYFKDQPYLISSDPYSLDEITNWSSSKIEQRVLDLSGNELMCAVNIND